MSEKTDFQKKSYTEEELVEIAKKRIKLKQGLYSHIAAYVIINLFLFIMSLSNINFMFDGYYDYPWMVLVGWGVGLAFHIHSTYQELRFKYNASAISRELEKIKSNLK
jgi:hypothetical protein